MVLPAIVDCAGAVFFAGGALAGCRTALGAAGCGTNGACCAAPGSGQSAALASPAARQGFVGRAGDGWELTNPVSDPHMLRCGAMQRDALVLTTPANSATGF